MLVETLLILALLISDKKRKEKERELRESEEKYRSLFDNSIDTLLDGRRESASRINKQVYKFAGRPLDRGCFFGLTDLLNLGGGDCYKKLIGTEKKILVCRIVYCPACADLHRFPDYSVHLRAFYEFFQFQGIKSENEFCGAG